MDTNNQNNINGKVLVFDTIDNVFHIFSDFNKEYFKQVFIDKLEEFDHYRFLFFTIKKIDTNESFDTNRMNYLNPIMRFIEYGFIIQNQPDHMTVAEANINEFSQELLKTRNEIDKLYQNNQLQHLKLLNSNDNYKTYEGNLDISKLNKLSTPPFDVMKKISFKSKEFHLTRKLSNQIDLLVNFELTEYFNTITDKHHLNLLKKYPFIKEYSEKMKYKKYRNCIFFYKSSPNKDDLHLLILSTSNIINYQKKIPVSTLKNETTEKPIPINLDFDPTIITNNIIDETIKEHVFHKLTNNKVF